MSGTEIAGLSVIAMLGLMLVGVPVGVAMASVAVTGMTLVAGPNFAINTLKTLPYAISSSYTLAAIPMFVLMGNLAASIGLIGELFDAANRWLARVRGSLYMGTTLASAGFAAVNGSTVVSAALFTRMALPEMIRLGYNKAAGAGCIAAAGTFAAMIPPSLTMVLYGVLTGESIGAMLLAGIIPGLLTVGIYIIGIRILVAWRPDWAPPPREIFSWKQRLESLKGLWAVLVLFLMVVGGIYSGLVSPSAAGAVGAAGALAIGLARRRLSATDFRDALRSSAEITAILFLIVVGGLLFSRLLLVSGFVTDVVTFIRDLGIEPWMFLAMVILMYLVLGMFMDPISMMVITLPFLYPIMKALGIEGIWFGIIVVKLIELSCITPPVGINLFTLVAASDGRVSTMEVYRGVIPFVALEILVLAILLGFPELSLWLPRQLM